MDILEWNLYRLTRTNDPITRLFNIVGIKCYHPGPDNEYAWVLPAFRNYPEVVLRGSISDFAGPNGMREQLREQLKPGYTTTQIVWDMKRELELRYPALYAEMVRLSIGKGRP